MRGIRLVPLSPQRRNCAVATHRRQRRRDARLALAHPRFCAPPRAVDSARAAPSPDAPCKALRRPALAAAHLWPPRGLGRDCGEALRTAGERLCEPANVKKRAGVARRGRMDGERGRRTPSKGIVEMPARAEMARSRVLLLWTKRSRASTNRVGGERGTKRPHRKIS